MSRSARTAALFPLVFTLALALAGAAAAEEVLLLLPKDFDARPVGGWGRRDGVTTPITPQQLQDGALALRFRGEEVSYRSSRSDHHDTGNCWVDIDYGDEYRATFRRGELRGTWSSWQRNYYRSCKDRDDGEYMRVRHEGAITGQANADGRLEMAVQVTDEEILDRQIEFVGKGNEGRFVMRDGWKKRNQAPNFWAFGLVFQLPVGELQSSQRLSKGAPPMLAPPPGRAVPESEPVIAERTEPGAEPVPPVTPPVADAAAVATPMAGPADVATPAQPFGEPAPPQPVGPENPPATPAETAAATVGSGLLVGIGAWLTARANGAGLGDLLGGLGRILTGGPAEVPAEAAGAAVADATPAAIGASEVAAPPAPADAMGAVASEIAAADARIEARRKRIEARDAEIRRDEAEILAKEEALGFDPLGSSLRDHFVEYQGELSRQGYRLINPGYDAALPVREVVDAGAFLAAQVAPGIKAVRCGEFAEMGARELEAELRRRHGAEADRFIVDKVFVDVARDDSWSGQAKAFLDEWVAPKNHVATRVITPDGRRFVLDYWEANRGSGCEMISEEKWLERWRERLGEDMQFCGSDENGGDENLLMNQVALYQEKQGATPEQALELFRRSQEQKIGVAKCDAAEKVRRLKRLETLVRTYERCGGFRGPGA